MTPERLTEFSIYVDDRPGELAGVLDAASAAGIDISTMSVTTGGGKGVIRLIGDPVDSLRDALESLVESGHGPLTESEVISVSIANRPNAFRDVTASFSGKGVNVLYAYLAPAHNGDQARCVLRVDNIDSAQAAIQELA